MLIMERRRDREAQVVDSEILPTIAAPARMGVASEESESATIRKSEVNSLKHASGKKYAGC
jgi:hypothetical protein